MKYKKLFISAGIVISALVVLSISVHLISVNWMNETLPDLLNKNPDRKYDMSFEGAGYSVLQKRLVIKDVKLKERLSSANSGTIHIKSISIEKPDLSKLYRYKTIETDQLVIDGPAIELYVDTKNADKRKEKLNAIWTDVFDRLHIRNLVVKNISFDLMQEENPTMQIKNIDVFIQGFNVDTSTLKNPIPINFDEIAVNCDSVSMLIDTIGTLNIQTLNLTKMDLLMSQIEFVPLLSRDEFIAVDRPKDNWTSFSIDLLGLGSFSWSFDSLGAPAVEAAVMHLDRMQLSSFVDKQYPLENEAAKPLFSEILRSLPVEIKLDSFRVRDAAVFAETRPPNKNSTGNVYFDQIYVSGYNFHNHENLNKTTELDILCRFMDEANIEAKMILNVNDKNDRFKLEGKMRQLTTTSLNKILEPLAGIETAGEIYGVDFNILANNYKAIGTVDFEYDDLKIKVMNKDAEDKNVLLSLLSNVALRNRNVKSARNFRQGEIDHVRDQQKAIFGYVWEAIKDGLMDTLVPIDIEKYQNRWERRKKQRS